MMAGDVKSVQERICALTEIKVQSKLDEPRAYLRPVWVSCAIAVLATVHYLWSIFIPHKELVCFIADDAFYELQIARHFLATGRWSFDGGFSTTTGFHLLNVYLMSLIPQLLTYPWLAIDVWMGVGLVLSLLTIFTITNFVYQKFGASALAPTFLVLTAPSFTLQSTGLLEFPYVTLLVALYLSAIFLRRKEHRSMLLGIFLLGFLGSVARSDFGGFPLAIFLTCSVAFFLNRRSDYLLKSFYGLVGASVGLAVVFLHNFLLSGHFLSSSAMTKSLWGRRLGYSPFRPIWIVILTLTSSGRLFIWILMFSVLVVAVRLGALALGRRTNLKMKCRELDGNDCELLAGCGVCAIVLYLLAYGADSYLQPWYTASFAIPLLLVLSLAARAVARDRAMRAYFIGVVVLLAGVNILGTYDPPWNHQRYMLEMAEYLQDHRPIGRIGGWNVGIVGFFTDGRVVNLDGLMNDQIYRYALEGRVEQYIDRAEIKHIVDFPIQITDPSLSEVLGFEGKSFSARLRPEHTITSKDRGDRWLDYTLFEIRDPSSMNQAEFSSTVQRWR